MRKKEVVKIRTYNDEKENTHMIENSRFVERTIIVMSSFKERHK